MALSWWQRLVWTPRAVQLREQLTLEGLLADQGEPTAAGEQITSDKAVRLSTVFACTRLLSDSVATLPLRAYRGDEQLPELPPLLRRPSADFELSEWIWATMLGLCLRGNSFGIITDRSGPGLRPSQVDLVSPDLMAVTREPDGNGTVRTVYRLGGEEIDPADVWHVKAFPQAGNPLGLSPIGAAREAIALGIASEKYGAHYFGDASVPSGVLESEQDIKEASAKRLKAEWKAILANRRRDIAVLGSGARFRAISIAPEEAQFIQTQKFNVSTIARFYGVPAEMVGGETAGHEAYTSPEMRSTDYLRFTLQPWISKLEKAISRLLPRPVSVKFNLGAFLRPTLKERYESHALGIAAGFLLKNEARALEDLPPIPGLDDPPPEPPTGAVA